MEKIVPPEVHPRHTQLAQRIIDGAAAGRWVAGRHLTEQELATMLQVSRTPVRAALRLLEDLKVVGSRACGGYVLVRDGEALQGYVIPSRPPTEEKLHGQIVRDRLSGKLEAEPTQADLVRRYGVGLPTVQRIFRRLEQEGLVERSGWRWSFIPFLETRQSQQASYEIRAVLEPAALLLPGFVAAPDLIRQLRDDHHFLITHLHKPGLAPMQIFDIDARFHETLASFGRNPFMLNVIRQQNALRRLLEVRTYSDTHRIEEWCAEHMSILDHIEAARNARAADLLKRHLGNATKSLEKLQNEDALHGADSKTSLGEV